jgi:Tol biopolymer transport system component
MWWSHLAAFCTFLVAAAAKPSVTSLLPLEGQTKDPALSPDGKTLAFLWCKPDDSCGIYLRQLNGGDTRLLIGRDKQEGLPAVPQWSPDGKHIAFARVYSHYDVRLFVRDVSGNDERQFGRVCDRAIKPVWTPDGGFLIASIHSENPPRAFNCSVRPLYGAQREFCSRCIYQAAVFKPTASRRARRSSATH